MNCSYDAYVYVSHIECPQYESIRIMNFRTTKIALINRRCYSLPAIATSTISRIVINCGTSSMHMTKRRRIFLLVWYNYRDHSSCSNRPQHASINLKYALHSQFELLKMFCIAALIAPTYTETFIFIHFWRRRRAWLTQMRQLQDLNRLVSYPGFWGKR